MIQPHIQLDTVNAKGAILPGDPARLDRIAKQLSDVQELAYNREFRSLIGTYEGVPIIACSTGIGGSSASIAIEELHNIGIDAMVRIGSCGSLREGIHLGDLILACGAIRDDGASKAYADVRYPAVPDTELLHACIEHAKTNGWTYHTGIVHSHESFYVDSNDVEQAYWGKLGALGADMETAALFVVGRLRGIRTASILNNVVVYGNDTSEAIGNYADGAALTAEGERRGINTALAALKAIAD